MEFIREVLGIVSQYYSYLLSGVGYTMLIALIGTAAGFLIGLLTGVIRTAPRSKNAVVRVQCSAHSTKSSTPSSPSTLKFSAVRR